LLALHIAHIFCGFSCTLVLLSHYSSNAVLDVGLVGSIVDAAHTVQKLDGLLADLSEVGFFGDGIIQLGSQLADLIGLYFMGLEVGYLGGEGEGGGLLFLGGFGVGGLSGVGGTL